jgi:hypothetical protein
MSQVHLKVLSEECHSKDRIPVFPFNAETTRHGAEYSEENVLSRVH